MPTGIKLAIALGCVAMSACAARVVESGTAAPAIAPSTGVEVPSSSTTLTTPSPTVVATTLPPGQTSGPTTEPPVVTATPAVDPLTGWDAVDRYIDITIVRGGSAAASLSVMRDGQLVHAAAFGSRVVGQPASVADRFRIASISKTITAVTALRLVESGSMTLDEPIGPLLIERLGVTNPAAGARTLTVRHLLAHRSGLAQYENLMFRNEVGSCAQAAVVGLTRSFQGEPGQRFQYSNLNFCLLGLAIEATTGQPYESVVQAQLLDPLGITGMRLAGTFDVRDGDVEHRSDEGRNYMEVLGAAGAWIASPSDLVAILDAVDRTTPGFAPLSPEMLDLMQTITTTPPPEALPGDRSVESTTTSTTLPPPPTSGYGLGLMIFGTGGAGAPASESSFGHTGTLESTHAMFVRRPDGLTWALTVSGDYPESTRELAKIMDNALLLGGFTDGTYTTPPPPLDDA
jgi:D-alanyl-D-alanine carboxypeptidase